MNHLSLEIFDLTGSGSKYAVLPDDTEITITDTSEIFASGDVWSHSFTLNTQTNAHIFGTSGEIHGARIHEQINKRRARLWVEGLPLYLGYLKLDDETEVDEEGNVDVSFESGQKTFEDLIEGAKANQVPMMSDVQIGMALWTKRWTQVAYGYKAWIHGRPKDGGYIRLFEKSETEYDLDEMSIEGEDDNTPVQAYPRLVLPKGTFRNAESGEDETVDFLNTDYPYTESADGVPTHPYCNVGLCYQRHGYEKQDQDGNIITDYNSEPEAQRGYEYMPPNRTNSAPNFFVIYWIRALMKHLGIFVEENQMMEVEDLRRLFFVNTDCAYEEPAKLRTDTAGSADRQRFGLYESAGLRPEYVNPVRNVNVGSCRLEVTDFYIEDEAYRNQWDFFDAGAKVYKVFDWDVPTSVNYTAKNGLLHKAFAKSDCFPDVDISTVIEALESGFGVRFLFSDDYRRVRIVLLRNIFQNENIQKIDCDIFSDTKSENCIRGFKMTYGNTEDTHFFYKGFDDKLPHMKTLWPDNSDTHDYSQWNLNASYPDLIRSVTAFDKTCSVTPNTGNAFGIKIDKDAKRYDDLYPSLFEFAGFMDAEDGDCTGEDNTIETINVGFTPIIMNDINYEQEKNGETDEQRFALFVDETMRPRRPSLNDSADYNDPEIMYPINEVYAQRDYMKVDGIVKPGEFSLASDTPMTRENLPAIELVDYGTSQGYARVNVSFSLKGYFNEGYRLYLQDNYEPNDDGVSPIETHDWGLTLGIMRGSGSDAHIDYELDAEDGEGNDTWEVVAGTNATVHPDTCDCYGREWDYNGDQSGIITETVINTAEQALDMLQELYPDSNAPFTLPDNDYIIGAWIYTLTDNTGASKPVLFATVRKKTGRLYANAEYRAWLNGHSFAEIQSMDASSEGRQLIVKIDCSQGSQYTLVALCRKAYTDTPSYIILDNGISSRYGRFSLKLRAEKPNPYFDPSQPESESNQRYLTIENENLRGRGLADFFYREYSYWVRNARIVKRTVRMELAQFLAIDKTKKVEVGDITGFIRKMQFSVSNQTGLGLVTMEIMYI